MTETSNPAEFTPWDSIDRKILQTAETNIASHEDRDIMEAICRHLQSFADTPTFTPDELTLSVHPILGINAALKVHLRKDVIPENCGRRVTGNARLLHTKNEEYLPLILLFGDTSDTLLRHEAIHLCQWLNPNGRVLSMTEVAAIASASIDSVLKTAAEESIEHAVDFLSRIVCFKTWTELEAYYWAEGQTGNPGSNVITMAHESALPFVTIEMGLAEIGVSGSEGMDYCRQVFTPFLQRMEARVPWVRDLVLRSDEDSLLDALLSAHDEYETDSMLAHLEECMENGF